MSFRCVLVVQLLRFLSQSTALQRNGELNERDSERHGRYVYGVSMGPPSGRFIGGCRVRVGRPGDDMFSGKLLWLLRSE